MTPQEHAEYVRKGRQLALSLTVACARGDQEAQTAILSAYEFSEVTAALQQLAIMFAQSMHREESLGGTAVDSVVEVLRFALLRLELEGAH